MTQPALSLVPRQQMTLKGPLEGRSAPVVTGTPRQSRRLRHRDGARVQSDLQYSLKESRRLHQADVSGPAPSDMRLYLNFSTFQCFHSIHPGISSISILIEMRILRILNSRSMNRLRILNDTRVSGYF